MKFNNQVGTKTDYECLDIELTEHYKTLFYTNFLSTNKRIIPNIESTKHDQIEETCYVVNPLFQSSKYIIRFDAIEIFPHRQLSKVLSYCPIDIIAGEKVTKTERLIFNVKCHILSRLLGGLLLEFGSIIYGKNLKKTKVNFADYVKDAKRITRELTRTVNGLEPPPFYQNSHCRICEFHKTCRTMLSERDDLSLLRGMSQKEIIKKKNRGIFTVLQFSYTFSPRKKKRSTQTPNRIEWALKALALREKKTHIKKIPKFQYSEIEAFLDFEGLPDENIIYLIGLIVIKNHREKKYSFWADSEKDEEKIFLQLFEVLLTLKNFTIYHYGSFEILSLKRFNKKSNNRYEEELNFILKHSVNILSFFSLNVYPPTYTNELKDIAQFLGFAWSDRNASGIQSIVWRKRWELSQDILFKKKLIQYNIEDCHALRLTKEWLSRIDETFSEKAINGDLIKVEDVKVKNFNNFGQPDYLIQEFKEIAKYAYFDYQREKIYLKTNPNVKRAIKRREKRKKQINKINRIIEISPKRCPCCGYKKFYEINRSKIEVDLKFINYGIKKWVTQYNGGSFTCNKCRYYFTPADYKQIHNCGNNLKIWSVNQYVTHRVSFLRIAEMLQESYNIKITSTGVYKFKAFIAKKYKQTYQEIRDIILNGRLIHADETKVKIKGFSSSCFVWVFTTMDSVFYHFRTNRKADFLKNLLKGFEGVLVSDFYSGYDSLPCLQQKCLIHLVRDLNDDLFKNQTNKEFKEIAINFGKLLRSIVETINTYGLKKRHLKKHKKHAEKFFDPIHNSEYNTELAISYQKRFIKNRGKLFTFLDFDGIPWNNNNGETAIKPFAEHRKHVDGNFTEKGINDYLILLSIQQTCKYRGLSFLEFLKSDEKSINAYSVKN